MRCDEDLPVLAASINAPRITPLAHGCKMPPVSTLPDLFRKFLSVLISAHKKIEHDLCGIERTI